MCSALSDTPRNELEANEQSTSADSLQEMFFFFFFKLGQHNDSTSLIV